MAKFYVQSGSLRTMVQAESGRKAAIWGVHQAMQQIMPIDDEENTSGTSHCETDKTTGRISLSKRIRTSERGFDRSDANEFSTLDILGSWNQMVSTLDRLETLILTSGV